MTNTPNPTTERAAQIIYNHSEATDDGMTCMGGADESTRCDVEMGGDQALHQAEMLQQAGLLSEGAPSDGDCRGYCEHGHAPCSKSVGEFMCTRAARHDGVCVACSEDVHDLTAALTAAGVAPQEPQALDPEKVAEVIEHENLGSECGYPHIDARSAARALCEAYKEGKLT